MSILHMTILLIDGADFFEYQLLIQDRHTKSLLVTPILQVRKDLESDSLNSKWKFKSLHSSILLSVVSCLAG